MERVQVVSIQVGMPQSYGVEDAVDPMDRPWTSGFVKLPVEGPVRVRRMGMEGDGQADLKNHGGVDKAVLGYSADHYQAWRTELDQSDFPYGAFGENLTIRGLTEAEASTMIVNGFIEPLVKELPMEYAIEMNRLIQLQMEGSVG